MSRAHCLSFQYSQTGSDCGNQMSFTVLILVLHRYKIDKVKFLPEHDPVLPGAAQHVHHHPLGVYFITAARDFDPGHILIKEDCRQLVPVTCSAYLTSRCIS